MSQLLVQASDRKELPPPSGGPSRTPGTEVLAGATSAARVGAGVVAETGVGAATSSRS